MPSRIATCSRILALAIAASLATVGSIATSASGAPSPAPAPLVAIEHADVLYTGSTTVDVSVSVALQRPVTGMSIRLRLLGANGAVLIEENQTRGRLEAATYVLGFTHDLRSKELREGRDRLEVQVKVAGQPSTTVTQPVYVIDPSRAPVRLAVVVRAGDLPATSPGGMQAAETSASALVRTEAESLLRAGATPGQRLTFAIAPFLLEQWNRAGARIPEDLPHMRVPYADPDVAGLEAIGALKDLGSQLEVVSLVASDTPSSQTSTGAVISGDRVSLGAARVLAAHGISYALLSPDGVAAGPAGRETSATPGVHPVVDTTLTALVFDAKASALLSGTGGGVAGLLDHLFDRLMTKASKGRPVVAVVRLEPGSPTTAADLTADLAALSQVPWVTLVTASEAAALPGADPVSLPASSANPTGAPEGYWSAVRAARTKTLALKAATGPADPEASACVEDVMFAESRAWAGADGRWADSAAGLAFASSADARASAVLSAVSLAVPTVTLSGNAGKVPVSITNRSGKELNLSLRIRSASVKLPMGNRIDTVVRPGENILSVPVDLRESLKGSLRFDLYAGSSSIASTACDVRASYIDRLGMLGAVVLVLLVLLWYVRRRGRASARLREDPRPDTAGS